MTAARPTLSLRVVHAEPPVEVSRYEGESDSHYIARSRSIHALGKRWLGHPEYEFQPRHSHNPEVSAAGREPYLAEIRRAAAADRARNQAHKRAQAVRAALGSAS